MDNLRKKSFISVSFCCLCKREEEIVDHCSFAKVVEYDFAIFGVQWVMPRGVVTLCFGQHPNSGIWEAILHFFFFLMWCIWRKRNMQSFEGYEQTILYMKQQHIRTLFEWMTMTGFFFLSFLSLLDFIDYHNFSTYLDLFLFLFLLFLFWLIIGFWDLNCIAPIVHSVYLGLLFWLQ